MVKAKSSEAEKELTRLEGEFNSFKENLETLQASVKDAPLLQTEEQTKMSTKEKQEYPKEYLKPKKTMGASKEAFNEKFRKDYEFKKEYVNFIAENKEIIGETIELWTKPFPGVPAELWMVPVNKPVWGPRYLAEQIKGAQYHIFKMEDRVYNQSSMSGAEMQYHGSMAVKNTVQRLDAHPVSQKKSMFMGSSF